jgi:nucleoside-diphosphate-sugar epimerase
MIFKMKILILGGTQMIGRNLVESLLSENKYELFLANRGITNPDLFYKKCKHIYIDRNVEETCNKLQNYFFDMIIDFSCYTINHFQNTFKYLLFNKYLYISTMSIFDEDIHINYDINDSYHVYRQNKLNTEIYIKSQNINNFLIFRPCGIYGEHDYTDRFYQKNGKYYWKCNHEEVGAGTMNVNDLTQLLLKHVNLNPESGEVNSI